MNHMEIIMVTEENLSYFLDFIPKKNENHIIWQHSFLMVGAVVEGISCGILILGKKNDITQLQWVYVAPDYRMQGIASAMLDSVRENAKELGIWRIIACYESDYPLDRLLLSRGFLVRSEKSYNYQMSIRELLKRPRFLAAFKRYKQTIGNMSFFPLNDMPGYVLRNSIISREYELNNYNKFLSCAAVIERSLVGYILIQENDNKNYHLEILETDGKNPAAAIGLICAACKYTVEMARHGDIPLDAEFSFEDFGKRGKGFAKTVFLMAPTEKVWFHIAKQDIVDSQRLEGADE